MSYDAARAPRSSGDGPMMYTPALLLCLATTAQAPTGRESLLGPGDVAPPFSLSSVDGVQFSLTRFVGTTASNPKTVVLVFFSTLCKPCRRQVPVFREARERWRRHGVEVVYVGVRDSPADLKETITGDEPSDVLVLPDRFGRVSARYGATILPHSVVIGTDGIILHQLVEEMDNLETVLDQQLATATGNEIPPRGERPAEDQPVGQSLLFARTPATQTSTADWQPLLDFVSKRLPDSVLVTEPMVGNDQFHNRLQAGLYDLASTGALQYLEVIKLYEPLVKTIRRDEEFYFGIIFVRDDSGIRNLEDLRGKSIAFASKRSTSGYLLPFLTLREAGLLPGDYRATFAGSHSKVAEAVLDGKADAGACFEDCRSLILPDDEERERRTTIIAFTNKIPGDPILVRKKLPSRLKSLLRRAFLSANEHRSMLKKISKRETLITGFRKASAVDYEQIRRALEEAGGP